MLLVGIFLIAFAISLSCYYLGYRVGKWHNEFKLKMIEENLLEFTDYQRWLEQNKDGLKGPDGELPEYF